MPLDLADAAHEFADHEIGVAQATPVLAVLFGQMRCPSAGFGDEVAGQFETRVWVSLHGNSTDEDSRYRNGASLTYSFASATSQAS